ncbi:helix-turn-helix domain-containing protein [Arenimonas aestuarii]
MNRFAQRYPGAAHCCLPEDDDALVDSSFAQQFLRISRNTLARLTQSGKLPVVRLGRACRYRAGDVRRLATPGVAQ